LKKKKLVIIEINFSPSTPAAKSLCGAIPYIVDKGWEVEMWSSELALDSPGIKWDRVPRVSRINPVQLWFFSIWVSFRYWLRRLKGELNQDEVILSIGPYTLWANLFSTHFISVEYLRQMKAYNNLIKPALHERMIHIVASNLERILWRMGDGRRAWMVVSDRLCSDLRAKVKAHDWFSVLPNSYNRKRFNPEVRKAWRVPMREKLGIGDGEKVFAFVGLGGFERKGLPLALKACSLLHEAGTACRLLVVGGKNSDPPDLSRIAADSGVSDLSFVVAHGRDPQIERLLSAADALLFPSYFEAFSLVEIESAALGLRLYLTPHYGSEMILQEGINGRFLPWNATGIAKILAEDIQDGSLAQGCRDAGRAVDEETFSSVFLEQLESAREWILRPKIR
jgi:glycosyltransferase involved in cell wall biosynthesis